MTRPTTPVSARHWADLRSVEFAGLDPERTVAVLPLGATEQHGPHLPLAVDSVLVEGVVQAALPHLPDDAPVFFLPTQTIGFSPEHTGFAGTLSFSSATLIAMWKDIGASVARAGVRKLVLFNAHGGQVSAMDLVGRELRIEHGLMVFSSQWWTLPLPDAVTGLFSADEHRFGVHAGEIETSMMLALRPERVAMDAARDFGSTSRERARDYAIVGNGKSAKFSWAMQDYNAEGAAGNAAAATADKGRLVVDAAGRALAELLMEVSSLPLSTVVP